MKSRDTRSVRTIEGRVAAITGAGSGIGRATAIALKERGCHLALVDRDEAALNETAELLGAGIKVSTHVVDVSDRGAMVGLGDDVVTAHGACHILINNAGITSAGRFSDDDLEDVDRLINVNVMGVVLGCHSFLPHLKEVDEGHIVNLSSMVAFVGLPRNSVYALTKGAVRGFSESLRAELAGHNIGVTAVFPGAINTNIVHTATGADAQRLSSLGANRLAPYLMTSPDTVARRIVGAIDKNRARTLIGPDSRMLDVVARLAPGRSGVVGTLLDLVAP